MLASAQSLPTRLSSFTTRHEHPAGTPVLVHSPDASVDHQSPAPKCLTSPCVLSVVKVDRSIVVSKSVCVTVYEHTFI